MHMNMAARALERAGDNAVDIAEQISYLVTGEFREFTDASHEVIVVSDGPRAGSCWSRTKRRSRNRSATPWSARGTASPSPTDGRQASSGSGRAIPTS